MQSADPGLPTPEGLPTLSLSSPANRENYTPPFGTWTQNMRLLHHYNVVICHILEDEESTAVIWREVVPETAFSHDFLMHGLLALSSLHYAQTHPALHDEFALISSQYQDVALQAFAAKLQNANEGSFEPYFFLATFLFIISMCSITGQHDPDTVIAPKDLAQSFMLLQGIKSILVFKPVETCFQAGPLGPLFGHIMPLPIDHTGPFQRRLDQLFKLTRELSPTFEAMDAQSSCLLAIESLRTTYAACAADQTTTRARRIWLWPVSLPSFFVDLISNHHHVALIILAHYAAFTRPFEHRQWMNKGWSSKMMAAVETALDEQWRAWVDWPKRSIVEQIDVDEMGLFEEI
ncbi:fungal zn binuclear cluster domain-containing protein [Colletotrichum scovillei]|uniref:Fungal zn binuclear cluster domain-containing protein n=1 Tax=Colletotrichum scovillei TaxID=1209932 RepID=A0A9P7QZB7_9PEZI|nr:fungal zn binuclear cluster domain-containing protein [Colletotrichum scovillei]KAG7052491.1 fungal zn binuclear cluster domain-containing protein [Colletotrichum scovillei]KAG7064782.1 fungal zn binuclear cluster domain-containing protein [Colletotrichum scovillei]